MPQRPARIAKSSSRSSKTAEPGGAPVAAVSDLRATLAALSGRIDSITQHLAVASRNFDEFSHEIRKHPNSLLLAPKADKLDGPEQ